MRIIQVYQTNPFKNGQGGGVRYVKNLLNGIKNECSEILFFGIGDKEQKDNIKLEPITKDMTGYIKFLVLLMMKLPFMNLSQYDIVHVHRLYFAIPFILLKPKLKIVCSLHGRTFTVFESNNGIWGLKFVKPFFITIERFAIKYIDYLVPVSQDVIDSFEKKYNGFSKNSKMTIASPMITFEDYQMFDKDEAKAYFGLEKNVRYLGFLGRLSDVKDIEFLIKLYKKYELIFQKQNIKLVFFGEGESKQSLVHLIDNQQLENHIVLGGEVMPYDIDKALACINLLLISSKHESGPIVMKEALICGIPVVTNDVGEVKDYIINHKNGYVVEKNYDSYFNAIQKLINNPLSEEDVLSNSLEHLKKCSVEYIANKYLKIYKEIISK